MKSIVVAKILTSLLDHQLTSENDYGADFWQIIAGIKLLADILQIIADLRFLKGLGAYY